MSHRANGQPVDDLTVEVTERPDPGQIRTAITAALTGLPWPPGPEHDIAAAVEQAVRARASAADGAVDS